MNAGQYKTHLTNPVKWPIFSETGKIGTGKNPKSGFFLLGFNFGYNG